MKEINIRYCYKIFRQFNYISPLESETLFSIMRKSLLLVVFLVSVCTSVFAQDAMDLFKAPDTVCANQPVKLISNVPDAKSHYWGFCSAYLYNLPTGANIGDTFSLDGPGDIEIAKGDDSNYYGFVVNATSRALVRLNYGKSLDNIPTITNFGTMDGVFPANASSMYMVRDDVDKNWYLFVTAGSTIGNSTLSRIDFGKSLANTPNIVTFGNLENKLFAPRGMFVSKYKNKWYGFLVNNGDSKLLRIDMDTNISLTPTIVEVAMGIPLLNAPTDIGPMVDSNKWYFFITNGGDGSVLRVEMDSLTNIMPTPYTLTGDLPSITYPTSITLLRDCDRIHAYITDGAAHAVYALFMNGVKGPYSHTDYSNIGQVLSPSGTSRVIRDRDNLFIYAVNQANNSISKIKFESCNRSNIKSSLTNTPPEYRYDTAGLYNIYYAVNEGMPDMQVKCKQIRVLPIPAIFLFPSDTLICQGDTLNIRVVSVNAITTTWTPNYNISNPDKLETKVWPATSTDYRIRMPFPLGTCIVDTVVHVTVKQVKADAGPDRTIVDGATTMIGGPNTIGGKNYLKRWAPDQYIDDVYTDYPEVKPPHDFTYYLTVMDTLNGFDVCVDIDTVVIRVTCDNISLPNAFMPESEGSRAQFGLLNRQIAKLETFKIYDRWGKEVFSTKDPTKQWDGLFNGEKAAVGVYVYEIDAFCLSGKRINKTGNVMLIR